MASVQKLTSCLWFDGNAEDAAKFYVSVFRNAKLGSVSYYPNEGQDIHGQQAGKVLVAEFEIEGQKFIGLNGGPQFKLSEAVSFVINSTPRRRSITSGTSSAAMAASPVPAAGSRTSSASPGRSRRR